MAKDSSFVNSPAECPAEPPSGYKGTGGGSYDGARGPGLPGRTSSPNAVPERTYEPDPPSIKKD